MNAITTTHNLNFESCPWRPTNLSKFIIEQLIGKQEDIQLFRIGTCEGQWFHYGKSYCILSIINNSPGNGHLDDVFEWFEHSCKRDKKKLRVLEVMNKRFRSHLIRERGFIIDYGTNDVYKIF